MRRLNAFLFVALLGSVATAAWLTNELAQERERSDALAAELARRPSSSIVDEVTAPTNDSPAALPLVSRRVAAPLQKPPQEATDRREAWEGRQREMMHDPAFREARRAQERLAYAPRRANLVRLLDLTPAQADVVIDLQLDKDAKSNEVFREDVTTDEARMERRARLEALDQKHQDELRSLLGEDKSSRLQTYMESRQTRMQVDRLRSELTESSALRDDQVEPLIAALHAERAQMQSQLQDYSDTLSWEGDQGASWRRYSDQQAKLWKTMNAGMHSSASSILTSAQLDALDGLLKRDYARFEAQQRVNRLQSKLELPASASSN